MVLACCLAGLTAVLLSQLRGEFQAIGQRDAPEAGATTGLYFALNDMDAQVANVLLAGGDTALAASRTQDLATYARDRATADTDLQQATASDALLTSQQSDSPAGRAPGAAIAYYQQAPGLMQASILPAVGSLTTVSAAKLDAAYQGARRPRKPGPHGRSSWGYCLPRPWWRSSSTPPRDSGGR